MMKLITSGVFVAGMAAVPVALSPHPVPAPAKQYRSDPRLETLRTFFHLAECPAEQTALLEQHLDEAKRQLARWN